jgi:phage terminase small subunit
MSNFKKTDNLKIKPTKSKGGRLRKKVTLKKKKKPTEHIKLTEQQQRFYHELLVDWNATQAAIRAGYSVKTAYSQGYRLYHHPIGMQYLRKLVKNQQRRLHKLDMKADDVLAEMIKIAKIDVKNTVSFDEDGIRLRPDFAVDGTVIKELHQTASGIRIKFHDRQKALHDLMEHFGLFIPKSEEEMRNTITALVARVAAREKEKDKNEK